MIPTCHKPPPPPKKNLTKTITPPLKKTPFPRPNKKKLATKSRNNDRSTGFQSFKPDHRCPTVSLVINYQLIWTRPSATVFNEQFQCWSLKQTLIIKKHFYVIKQCNLCFFFVSLVTIRWCNMQSLLFPTRFKILHLIQYNILSNMKKKSISS